ncbi:MAG: glycosyltransferase family 2 protein [Actinomycetes bacterium]
MSVVVASYNPGPRIDRLLDSLDRQSLRTDQFEVILVDDGSTDGTDERLRQHAAARPNVRTTRIPNSGWPGKPRNIGLDMARGEYVFFADHDDFFGDEALERMYDYAKTNDSDVVVAREARIGRGPLPGALFTTNRANVDLSWGPLLQLLTPHKLFRREFLTEHGLRFPEGKRRLEDHAFVVPAYFAAKVISVLADYPCYYWVFRGNDGNNSRGIDPDTYYPHLEEILDVVEQNTEPGPERDRLLAHWYRSKVLKFVQRSISWEPERRDSLLRNASRLANERFAASDAYLGVVRRLLSQLLRAGQTDTVVALCNALAGLTSRPELRSAAWEGGALRLTIEAVLRYSDGQPVRFRREGDRTFWVCPVDLGPTAAGELDVTSELAAAKASLVLRDHDTGVQYAVAGDASVALQDQPTGAVLTTKLDVSVDPRTAALGQPLPAGRWQVRLSAGGAGLDAVDALPVASSPAEPALVDGVPVGAYRAKSGNLALAVAVPQVGLIESAQVRPDDVHISHGPSGSRLHIDLPRVHVAGDGVRTGTLSLGGLPLPARLVADGATSTARLESWFSALPGNHRLVVNLDGESTTLHVVLQVAQDGTVRAQREPVKPVRTKKALRTPRLRKVARRVPGLRDAYRSARRKLRA